jgi:hypothetical protein
MFFFSCRSFDQVTEWTPFLIHCYSKYMVALGIEPGTSGSAARNSDHKTTLAAHGNATITWYCFICTDTHMQ